MEALVETPSHRSGFQLTLHSPHGGDSAKLFAYMNSLTHVSAMPEDLLVTGPRMFDGCTWLKTVCLPRSLLCISEFCFHKCAGGMGAAPTADTGHDLLGVPLQRGRGQQSIADLPRRVRRRQYLVAFARRRSVGQATEGTHTPCAVQSILLQLLPTDCEGDLWDRVWKRRAA
eukprot:scaffold143770_cov30-Tisochrysis_lutea.AAC.1